jgi:hypothetical protein
MPPRCRYAAQNEHTEHRLVGSRAMARTGHPRRSSADRSPPRTTFLKKLSMSRAFDEVEVLILGGLVGAHGLGGRAARATAAGAGPVFEEGRSRPGRQARPEGKP